MPDWNSLPLCIREDILEYVTTHERIAQYSTVSEEWRCAVEEKTFRRIRIDTPVLASLPYANPNLRFLNGLRKRQRGLVRHIWLNIALQRYNCPDCCRKEFAVERNINARIMEIAIVDLFTVLVGWEHTEEGLTLEINAYSPSDSNHWFQGWYFGAPGEERTLASWSPSIEPEQPPQFRRRHPICEDGLRRPFETCAIYLRDLPMVDAVTKFLIRRQCRRQFNPDVLFRIWKRLPCLEHIMHEAWRPWGNVSWYAWDDYFGKALCHDLLLSSVKRITVFEDFNSQHQFLLKQHRLMNQMLEGVPLNSEEWTVRSGGRSLAESFAKKSKDLEHLSVAFVIDAVHFFDACEPEWRWDELRSLTLTSKSLSKGMQPGQVHPLLQAAARAALGMPKLEGLTLWAGNMGEACAFTYRRYQEDVSITWRANWEFELGSRVRSAWEAVAKMHSPRSVLRVEEEMLRGYDLISHGDAIHHLGLHWVIDSMSLKQIRKESRRPSLWRR
ncbi:hypothetical protein ACHAQI_008773 [Fusarium lateritium]